MFLCAIAAFYERIKTISTSVSLAGTKQLRVRTSVHSGRNYFYHKRYPFFLLVTARGRLIYGTVSSHTVAIHTTTFMHVFSFNIRTIVELHVLELFRSPIWIPCVHNDVVEASEFKEMQSLCWLWKVLPVKVGVLKGRIIRKT